jgi:hypothetical protein
VDHLEIVCHLLVLGAEVIVCHLLNQLVVQADVVTIHRFLPVARLCQYTR